MKKTFWILLAKALFLLGIALAADVIKQGHLVGPSAAIIALCFSMLIEIQIKT